MVFWNRLASAPGSLTLKPSPPRWLQQLANVVDRWYGKVGQTLPGAPSPKVSEPSLLKSEMSMSEPATRPSTVSPLLQPAVPQVGVSRFSDAPLGHRKKGSL